MWLLPEMLLHLVVSGDLTSFAVELGSMYIRQMSDLFSFEWISVMVQCISTILLQVSFVDDDLPELSSLSNLYFPDLLVLINLWFLLVK